jgi:proliferating cell nuclear antigen
MKNKLKINYNINYMLIEIKDKKKKDIFISIFNTLKNSSSRTNATFNNDSCHIQGMDNSHVCLFDLILKDKWFNSFNVSNKINLSFDTNIFYSIINTKSDEQNLIIQNNENDDFLNIELITNGNKKCDYDKYFKMQLMDYEYDEMNIPQTDYDAELSLPSKKINDMLLQLSNFGNDLNIICAEECVDFITKGPSGEMRVNIPIEDMNAYSVVEGEEVNLTYSIHYISKMCITNKLSTNINFNLSNECPMKINYDLGDDSLLTFYIAPKMADD